MGICMLTASNHHCNEYSNYKLELKVDVNFHTPNGGPPWGLDVLVQVI